MINHIAAVFVLTLLFGFLVNDARGESTDPAQQRTKKLKMYPFDGANSSYWQSLLSTEQFDIKPQRRRYWDLSESGESTADTEAQLLFPFPIVKDFKKSQVLKSKNWYSKKPLPKKDWMPTGIRGVGPVYSFSTATVDGIERYLLGTQASGLYYKTSENENWRRLSFPRRAAQRVIINPGNPNHFIVLSDFHLSSPPSRIYQSCDKGATWYASDELSLTDATGRTHSLLATEIQLIGKVLTLAALNTDKDRVVIAATPADCKRFRKKGGGNEIRPVSVELIERGVYLSRKATGRLKMERQFGLVSIEDAGVDTLYKTSNAGANWESILSFDSNYWIAAYDSVDNGRAIIVALQTRDGVANDFKMMLSKDGGQVWNDIIPQSVRYQMPGSDTSYTLAANRGQLQFEVQDITLRSSAAVRIGIFGYMRGYLESNDGGQSFRQNITGLEDVWFLPPASNQNDALAIVAEDLRGDVMVMSEDFNRVFLPTDQSLYEHNRQSGLFSNLSPNLYLAEARNVAVTQCPRLYTGLWHVGAYWVDENGAINGFNGTESDGFGVSSEGNECERAAYSLGHGIMPDGMTIDRAVSNALGQSRAAGGMRNPFGRYPRFAAGAWWYLFNSQRTLFKIDLAANTFVPTYPFDDAARSAKAIGVDFVNNQEKFYVIDSFFQLSRYTQANGWELIVDIDNDFLALNPDLTAFGDDIAVGGDRIVWYGSKGALVSGDAGVTFNLVEPETAFQAATVDSCGWIYLAKLPTDDGGGVFVSKDGGVTFAKLGTKDSQSYVRGLTVDEVQRVLYAATFGESILKYQLTQCN